MKYISNRFSTLAMITALLFFGACQVDEINDPNNPSLASVTSDASKAELQTLVTGLEARHRVYYGSATQMFGSFGREVWAFFGSDPRFMNDWLGLGLPETYPDFFASAGTYVTPYLAVKQANVLVAAADGSTNLTPGEQAGYRGFAKTVKGHQLLYPLLQQFQNGIRIDVEDPNRPGPIVDYSTAIAAIQNVLADGYADLQTADESLPFFLTNGYDGFNSASGLGQVNQAIAARAALYAGDWNGALTALDNSFMNLNPASEADLLVGPAHVYGEAPDINNPLFYEFDRSTSTILVVHPALIEDAIPGDGRLAKFAQRTENPVTNATTGLVADYQDARWSSNTAPIPFIRNEELILIYAEAKARTSATDDAVAAINTIRNIHGIGDYAGDTDLESLIDEIIFQRRYSLWAEAGHRWVDLRRTDRLNENYVDLRDEGSLFTQVARRTSESN